jgi:hypothetical protein
MKKRKLYFNSDAKGRGAFLTGLSVLIVWAVLAVLPVPIYGQEAGNGKFTVSVEGVGFYIDESYGWALGPRLSCSFAFSGSAGIYVSAQGFLRSSRGYTPRLLVGDAGLCIYVNRSRPNLILLGGFSFLLGDDSDGSRINGIGVHLGARSEHWFSRSIGACGSLQYRFWKNDHEAPSSNSLSLSAGLAIRF